MTVIQTVWKGSCFPHNPNYEVAFFRQPLSIYKLFIRCFCSAGLETEIEQATSMGNHSNVTHHAIHVFIAA